jgi:trans-aconitate 2-methyltransferase
MWDPDQYLVFGDERSRPFVDLVRRIDVESPQRVVDLGCGPGNLTALLSRRWPEATVTGIDSSPEMIQAARAVAEPGRLDFEVADLCAWAPDAALGGSSDTSTDGSTDRPIDVIVSNATLQWVPGHLALLGRFVGWLAPGGCLAFQVPGNFRAPSHRLLSELRRDPRWAAEVGEGAARHLEVEDPAGYATALLDGPVPVRVDAWETTYLHLLTGPDPVLEWVKGTGLRPVLARLEDAGDGSGNGSGRAAFLAEYGARLRAAYPSRPDGRTPFPFRRIFVVAHRT